jgi:hypothetical protein
MSDGKKNCVVLREVLGLTPSVSTLASFATVVDLKQACDVLHPLMYPLLQWLITSNRSHLRALDQQDRCPGGATHQFLLLTADPAREQYFQIEKAKSEKTQKQGSILLTHGSALSNWHIILRTGLRTAKSSDLAAEVVVGLKGSGSICEGGAIGASGNAIWLSMQPQVSMGYTKAGQGWPNSTFGVNLACMVICEVVNDPARRELVQVAGGSHVEGPHEYVCTDARTIAPRYFWVWDQSSPPGLNNIGQWDGSSCTGPGTIDHLIKNSQAGAVAAGMARLPFSASPVAEVVEVAAIAALGKKKKGWKK